MHSAYIISKLSKNDPLPYHLLLLADETKDAIGKYIHDSEIYVVEGDSKALAVFALYKIDDTSVELKNIAVLKELQGKGIGTYLITEIKRIATQSNYQRLIVGTADGSMKQIRFYEKNGFEKYAVRKNFFIDNYPAPIVENGRMLKDMVMLKIEL